MQRQKTKQTLRRETVSDYLTQLLDEAADTLQIVQEHQQELSLVQSTTAMQLLGCMSNNLMSLQQVLNGGIS